MRKPANPIGLSFEKGHYGGFGDTVTTLIDRCQIPLGYYWGEDVYKDDSGCLRARPKLEYLVTYASSAYNPIGCFKLGGSYYTICNSGPVKRYSGAAWSDVTNSPTYSSQCNVEFISAAGNATPYAVVSSCNSEPTLFHVTGGTGANNANSYAKGIASHEEGRLFCFNGGYVYYSDRGDFTSGYDTGAGGQWFMLGNSCDDVIGMMNVAGSLYIFQCSSSIERVYLWRKTQTYSDPDELIDMTSFQQVYGGLNGTINNKVDGMAQMGGNLFVWMRGIGLCVLGDGGFKCLSEEIYAGNPANLDCDCVVAVDERAKLVFVKKSSDSTTMVYNYRDHNWHKWNINVTGKGFGNAGGMFSVAGTLSPARVGALCTAAGEDTSIVPTVYTPALNMGAPMREKFITDLYLDGEGITTVYIYTRQRHEDSFALWKTLTVTDKVIHLEGDHTFGECYFKIVGSDLFTLKNFGVAFDIGDVIYES